jgi:hypothetical protein
VAAFLFALGRYAEVATTSAAMPATGEAAVPAE